MSNNIIKNLSDYYKKWDKDFYKYYKNDKDFEKEIKKILNSRPNYIDILLINEIYEIIKNTTTITKGQKITRLSEIENLIYEKILLQ